MQVMIRWYSKVYVRDHIIILGNFTPSIYSITHRMIEACGCNSIPDISCTDYSFAHKIMIYNVLTNWRWPHRKCQMKLQYGVGWPLCGKLWCSKPASVAVMETIIVS